MLFRSGTLEAQPKMSDDAYQVIIQKNRLRLSVPEPEEPSPSIKPSSESPSITPVQARSLLDALDAATPLIKSSINRSPPDARPVGQPPTTSRVTTPLVATRRDRISSPSKPEGDDWSG